MARLAAKPRWGRVAELDRRIRVGSQTWKALPNRLKHLSSWRRAHMFGGHMPVRMYGTRHKIRPSSNLRLTGRVSKLAFIQKRK